VCSETSPIGRTARCPTAGEARGGSGSRTDPQSAVGVRPPSVSARPEVPCRR
jgi:hypothetical protein